MRPEAHACACALAWIASPLPHSPQLLVLSPMPCLLDWLCELMPAHEELRDGVMIQECSAGAAHSTLGGTGT